MSRVVLYRDKCIGCGVCFEQQPSMWRLSRKDGKAILLNSVEKRNVFVAPVSETEIKGVKQVSGACPARSIKMAN